MLESSFCKANFTTARKSQFQACFIKIFDFISFIILNPILYFNVIFHFDKNFPPTVYLLYSCICDERKKFITQQCISPNYNLKFIVVTIYYGSVFVINSYNLRAI